MTDKQVKKPTDADRSIGTLVNAATGALSHPTLAIKEIGAVIQHTLQGRFTEGLFASWNRLADAGRVTPDYLNTPHGLATFREVLRALELNDTDEARFEAVRNIFLNDALSDEDRNELLVIRILKITSTLNGSEILIVKTLAENESLNAVSLSDLDGFSDKRWQQDLAEATGLRHGELIEQDIKSLMEKKIISPGREHSLFSVTGGKSVKSPSLSGLGREIYDYIREPIYDNEPIDLGTPPA